MAEQSINFYTDRTLAEAEQAYAELAEKLDEAQAKWAKKIEENSKPMTLAGFDTESSSALHQNMQELAELEQMAAGLSTSSLLKTKVAEFNELAISAEQAAYVAERNIFTAEKLGNATHEAFKSMEDPLAEGIKNGDSIGDIAAAMGDALHGFAAQKTAHLLMEAAYETILAGATALIPTRAWESGAHLSAAAMYASGAALMGTFTYAMGKAHDGIDYIPKEGTWLLDKGERVVDSRTNKDLKDFIAGSGGGNVNVNVTINGGDKAGVMAALPELERTIINAVSGNIIQGGAVKRAIMDYTR